jgi:exopolysaccharide biosynthesis polyprenyl glycosylphosphotransferase
VSTGMHVSTSGGGSPKEPTAFERARAAHILRGGDLADTARRNKQAELALAAAQSAEAAVTGRDDIHVLGPAGVRPLHQLRPVPPQQAGSPPGWVRGQSLRPVYDPFTVRRRRLPEWQVNYTVALVAVDVVAAALGATLAVTLSLSLTGGRPQSLLALILLPIWPALVGLMGGYAERRLGTGDAEYRRVLAAGLVGISTLSMLTLLVPAIDLRQSVLLGMPVAVLATLFGRILLRRRLHRARRRGLMTKQVVVIGREVALLDLVQRLRRDPTAGLAVVGACVTQPERAGELEREGIPVLGGLEDAVRVLDEVRADAVVVASASETAGQYLRDLSWRLEGTAIEVLVVPGVIEVSPRRLQVRETTSVPLIQVREPEFRGSRRVLKSLMDRVCAALLLFAGLPVFLLLAAAVRISSKGPVFYRHRRIGKHGREFDLLKFRSMVVDADRRVAELWLANEGNDVQFKMRRDPRVTRVGQLLRRSSLDELPQLFNVVFGHMSLVGPRPHVTREVEQYGPDMRRRLLVKPGITGLWQVSGRSDLSWDESVELDVRYVENWSLGLDFSIMWRTVRAVVRGSGAY